LKNQSLLRQDAKKGIIITDHNYENVIAIAKNNIDERWQSTSFK
jgi:ABC-type lipopolysaccharide export system ATPase subunit